MKRIIGRVIFFEKHQLDVSKAYQVEVIHFYMMLLKMKKNRPDLNVHRIMVRLYPNFKSIEALINVEIT